LNFVNGYTMLKLPQYSVYFNKFSDGAKWWSYIGSVVKVAIVHRKV
jgi:hypothetical protein